MTSFQEDAVQGDEGLVRTGVERYESTGVHLVQNPENRIRTVITSADIYLPLLEESPFI